MAVDPQAVALPRDLRNMGYPVCDRAAFEIERLRAQRADALHHLTEAAQWQDRVERATAVLQGQAP
jgi:hypothetical protein